MLHRVLARLRWVLQDLDHIQHCFSMLKIRYNRGQFFFMKILTLTFQVVILIVMEVTYVWEKMIRRQGYFSHELHVNQLQILTTFLHGQYM